MKHLNKRYIVLISVLALLLVGNLVFFFVTAGKTAEKDGLLQNSRLYMRDVYYADGEIHYVLVNDTPWQSVISYYATVQKLENGEWVDIPFCRSEPESALVGALLYYEKISSQAKDYINDGGYLIFEIGYDQGEDVMKILDEKGYKNISCIKDLAQRDRVIVCTKNFLYLRVKN